MAAASPDSRSSVRSFLANDANGSVLMTTGARSYASDEPPILGDETSGGTSESETIFGVETSVAPEAALAVQDTTMPEDDEWHFIVAPYLWVVDTSGTNTIGPIVQELDLGFDAVLDQLKGAFTLHFEANKRRGGVVTDFSYVDVGKGGAFQIPRPDGSTVSGDLGVKLLFWEAWGFYRLGDERNAFDLMGGIRYNRTTTDIDFSNIGGPAVDFAIDWLDPIVGARWVGVVHPKLRLMARADFGGFGAGSELTTNLQGGIGILLREKILLVFQYRWMDVEYEQGTDRMPDLYRYDATSQGVLIGMGFEF